jgi:hypothetical protein
MAISSALGSSALLPAGLGFRNLLINGDFRINQRAFSSTTTDAVYGHDRWQLATSGGTTYSTQAFTLGNTIPNQEPINYARFVTTGQSGNGVYSILSQKIEDVRTCAGQQVTVSFYAKAASGTPKAAIEVSQNFGTGGSPSGEVNTYLGQVVLSTSWTRYVVTGLVPSIAGKTLGSASSYLRFMLWVSAGTDYNSRSGSIGIQSNTFDFWGVQVEQNFQPTPFEQRPIGVELQLCQRYYEKSYPFSMAPGTADYSYLVTMLCSAGASTTGEIIGNYYWSAWKRVAPTVTWYDHSGNINKITRLQLGVANHGNNTATNGAITERFAAVSSSSGNTAQAVQFHFTAQAEL